MKIYTGGGDRGKTSLFSGERVSKCYARVEAYGDIDELNSSIGVLAAFIEDPESGTVDQLEWIQSRLFSAGAHLAVSPGSASADMLDAFTDEPVRSLEGFIDLMESRLPQLKEFIVPGGARSSALAHSARTVCRRAERRVLAAVSGPGQGGDDENMKNVIAFLNRLSDYFFVLARFLNCLAGVKDLVWKK